mgnify:CR=1 FL=1
MFGLPTIVFTAMTSFAVGLRWRKPILVFVLPVAMILVLRVLPLELVSHLACARLEQDA